MSAKPTPGPWAVQDIGFNCLRITGNMTLRNIPSDLLTYYGSIATVTQRDEHPRYDVGISRATCAANARMMASAPDLLAALKLLLASEPLISAATDAELESGLDDEDEAVRVQANAWLVARAAIRKAEVSS
jgi:hypothetical protein